MLWGWGRGRRRGRRRRKVARLGEEVVKLSGGMEIWEEGGWRGEIGRAECEL
jgi:hypothetical protein